MNMNIPDITKITWQLNIALIGAVFSIFALIYRPEYIFYGFITFLYGVVSHLHNLIYDTILKEKSWRLIPFFIFQTLITIVWIIILIVIGKQ